jgi:hypothetical protein
MRLEKASSSLSYLALSRPPQVKISAATKVYVVENNGEGINHY